MVVAAAEKKINTPANVSFWSYVTPRSRTEDEKVKCGYLMVRDPRSILESCMLMGTEPYELRLGRVTS